MHPSENAPPPRLTLRFLLRQLVERFFNIEHGWLRTVREMFTEPGAMIRRYIEADRASYANPLSYVLMASAISILIQKTSGFQDRLLEELRSGMVRSPGQLDMANQTNELVFQNLLYVSFGIYIPFAILLRWFFRRSGLNLAETFVFVFFSGGHMAFLGLMLVVLFLILNIPMGIYGTLGILLGLVYYSYAAIGLYGGRLGTIVKTCLAYLIAFGTSIVVMSLLVLVYILAWKSSWVSGEDWNVHRAAEENLIEVARDLLEKGADVGMTLQRTPLHVASEKGHVEMVELLIEHGADVNALDHLGQVPMFLALNGSHQEVARLLATAGTKAETRTHSGNTLLITALRRDDLETARWALDGGAPVNAIREGSRRATALMAASEKGDLAMVELLLRHGADPSLTNTDGETALDLASGEAAERLRQAVPQP